MALLEILGYIGAALIGLSLGLIGGGGSILTVPVLVYLFALNPVMATAYSLFIVGVTSLVGSYSYFTKGLISLRTAVVFGLPSMMAVYITRKWVVPAIPNEICVGDAFCLSKGALIMVVFAVMMVAAATAMIRRRGPDAGDSTSPKNAGAWRFLAIPTEGVVVGFLTGLVGAGGGFLIIPALVLFGGLDMKKAVGTSLLIIAAKSLVGFVGDLANYAVDWGFLLVFTGIAIVGILIGGKLAQKIHSHHLKRGFGWFVLAMGGYVLIKELFF